MAVAQAQAARLESLAQHMQAAGLLREDALGGGDAGEEEAEEEQAGGEPRCIGVLRWRAGSGYTRPAVCCALCCARHI